MKVEKRNRKELKDFFVKNAIPTEGEFADLIDGMLNQKDDGIVKLSGSPLSIEASGDDVSQKKAINFYKNFSDTSPSWVLSLNPRSDPANAATAKPGFSVSDAVGNSRLFIDESTGDVGIGTTVVGAKLNVNGDIRTNVALISDNAHGPTYASFSHRNQGTAGGYALLQHSGGETYLNAPTGKNINFRINNATHMRLVKNGNVGIGTNDPGAKLDVRGNIFAGNSDIYFTKTNHNYTGTGETRGHAAIENAKDHDALMILGRAGTGRGRAVKLWDYLQVNGTLEVTNTTVLKQENWKNAVFQNGWVNYGSPYNFAGYFKDSLGIVHLRGLVKGGTLTQVIFTLPVGYRPVGRELQIVSTNHNVSGRADILNNGSVYAVAGNNTWFSLDGITFRAA